MVMNEAPEDRAIRGWVVRLYKDREERGMGSLERWYAWAENVKGDGAVVPPGGKRFGTTYDDAKKRFDRLVGFLE
jgi:hypothetical protein